MQEEIEKLAQKLLDFGASSVFLYGSKARGDASESSDWELGAIYEDDKYKERSELAALAPEKVSIYPFHLSELAAGRSETPFNQAIWLNEVIRTAKTVAGDDIISTIPPPHISEIDLISDAEFSKARALDAMIACRGGNLDLATEFFVKSCMFGLRNLILRNGGAFPLSYEDIATSTVKYLPKEYKGLPQKCLAIRGGSQKLDLQLTFDNIGLFTDVLDKKPGNT